MAKDYLKRFSVFINGLLYAAFESEQEARDYIAARWYRGEIATIWDNESRDYLYTEVRV